MIIGREKEIKKLQELYNSEVAELVALYGRRRVGKTFLIDNVFKETIFFRHRITDEQKAYLRTLKL